MSDPAKRAVACKHWRWMPGMLSDKGRTLGEWRSDGVAKSIVVVTSIEDVPSGVTEFYPRNLLPDLEDPATLGCLLALARKAWDDPTIYVYSWRRWDDEIRWDIAGLNSPVLNDLDLDEPSELSALVAALEAAP